MKSLIAVLFLSFSIHAFAKPITAEMTATKVEYNADKKYFEVSFKMMAGVYKADADKVVACLRSSVESKQAVSVSYEPMGLKITDCASSK